MPINIGNDAFEEIRIFLHPDTRVALQTGRITLLLDFAKAFADRQLLLGRQFLITEEQNLVADPGSMQFIEQVVIVDNVGNLQARDGRAEGSGDRNHIKAVEVICADGIGTC